MTPSEIGRAGPGDDFARNLGLELTSPGVARLTVRPNLVNAAGLLLGPVVFSLVDYAMGDVIFHAVGDHRYAVTVSLSVNFLTSTDRGLVTATAVLDRAGRTVAGSTAQVHAEDGTLIATAVGTFAVRERRPGRPAPSPSPGS